MHTKSPFLERRKRPSDSMNQHRVAFPTLAREVVRISDVILEVLDARFLEETRNLQMEKDVAELGKKLVFVVNKADLVDLRTLKAKLDVSGLHPYILFSCTKAIGLAKLRERIKIEVRKLKVEHKKAHVGIIGYPNTGKSSIINILAGRAAASRSPESGHTKGIQKIRFNRDILILDTPGVFAESSAADSSTAALKKHGKIGIRTFDKVRAPDMIVLEIMKDNPGVLEKYYSIEANGDTEVLLETLGKKNNFLLKGRLVDTDRAARLILKSWQEGKIRK